MVDLQALRRTIEAAPSSPAGKMGAIVTTPWLEEVERDLRELTERRKAEGAPS